MLALVPQRQRRANLFTAALARTELIRAVARAGAPEAIEHAQPLELPALDAIHLAAAQSAGSRLEAVVTYDVRMTGAAEQVGLTVVAPR